MAAWGIAPGIRSSAQPSAESTRQSDCHTIEVRNDARTESRFQRSCFGGSMNPRAMPQAPSDCCAPLALDMYHVIGTIPVNFAIVIMRCSKSKRPLADTLRQFAPVVRAFTLL